MIQVILQYELIKVYYVRNIEHVVQHANTNDLAQLAKIH
jgi:hypothetical protein